MQRTFDFDQSLVERIDEALPAGTGVACEVLRHVWCLVARLHRADAARGGTRGCYASAATLAEFVREKLKSKKRLVESVERALAWLQREGLLFTRVTPKPDGRGNERRRYVDFAAAGEWLARLIATPVFAPDQRRFSGATNAAFSPRPTPLLEPDQRRFLSGTNAAFPADKKDLRQDLRQDPHPPLACDPARSPDPRGGRDGGGERSIEVPEVGNHPFERSQRPGSQARPPQTPLPDAWRPILARLVGHGVDLPKGLCCVLAGRGVPPALAAAHLDTLLGKPRPPAGSLLYRALLELDAADAARWIANQAAANRSPRSFASTTP